MSESHASRAGLDPGEGSNARSAFHRSKASRSSSRSMMLMPTAPARSGASWIPSFGSVRMSALNSRSSSSNERTDRAGSGSNGTWNLAIGLSELTRSQAETYLTTKLRAAGCTEPIFTPRAVTRLHGLSAGNPRGLQQLASLSLMAGFVRGLEVIPPDLIDGIAGECCNRLQKRSHNVCF